MAGKIIELEQGSADWLAWRFTGIGGSDAPAVQNLSPYKSALMLAKEKIARVEAQDESKEFIFGRGHKVEAVARAEFEKLTGEESKPVCMVHPSHPELIVSLDGFNSRIGTFEAKLVGAEVLKHASATGEIPEHHKIQIHHGFNVSGADVGRWYGQDPKGNGVLLEIPKEKKLATQIQSDVLAFWEMIHRGVLPALSELDVLVPEDETLLVSLRDAKELMENASAEFERVKAEVLAKFQHSKIKGGGLHLFKTEKSGSIPWSEIPEVAKVIERVKAKEKGAYAETFRKKGSVSWTVKVETPKKGAS